MLLKRTLLTVTERIQQSNNVGRQTVPTSATVQRVLPGHSVVPFFYDPPPPPAHRNCGPAPAVGGISRSVLRSQRPIATTASAHRQRKQRTHFSS